MSRGHSVGDYVVPTDLPRTFVCRVEATHAVGRTALQVLELVPLHGPWAAGTRLVRGSDTVRRALPRELWSAGAATTPAAAVCPPLASIGWGPRDATGAMWRTMRGGRRTIL